MRPDLPPFGFPVLLDEAGAAQLALCSVLSSAQTVLAMIPLPLRCSAVNNGNLRALYKRTPPVLPLNLIPFDAAEARRHVPDIHA